VPSDPQPLDERSYQYHITRHIRTKAFEPGAWLLRGSESAENTEHELPIELWENPLEAFADPATNLTTAAAALELYARRLYRDSPGVEREETRKTFTRDMAGRRALLWDLRDYNEVNTAMGRDIRFVKLVAHCLVAEGTTESLREWIYAEQAKLPEETSRQYFDRVPLYNGFKARGMVEALAYWTTKTDPFQDAIECFLEMLGSNSMRKIRISMSFSGEFLAGRLQSGLSTDAASYDRFVEGLSLWMKDPGSRQWATAQLALSHPTHKDPTLMLDFFRNCAGRNFASTDPFVSSLLDPRSRNSSSVAYFAAVRAAQLLEQTGQSSDARWLLAYVRQTVPHHFGNQRKPGLANTPHYGKDRRLPRSRTQGERSLGFKPAGVLPVSYSRSKAS